MSIAAVTAKGKITVFAGKGYERRYRWNNCEGSVTLWARCERWYGARGIYYPGPGITWWSPCDGINRAVVEEGQQHFESDAEIVEWLATLSDSYSHVYRNDGIVVDYHIDAGRAELDLDIWQVCVRGAKPKTIPGANDAAIEVTGVSPHNQMGNATCQHLSAVEMSGIRESRKMWREKVEAIRRGRAHLSLPKTLIRATERDRSDRAASVTGDEP